MLSPDTGPLHMAVALEPPGDLADRLHATRKRTGPYRAIPRAHRSNAYGDRVEGYPPRWRIGAGPHADASRVRDVLEKVAIWKERYAARATESGTEVVAHAQLAPAGRPCARAGAPSRRSSRRRRARRSSRRSPGCRTRPPCPSARASRCRRGCCSRVERAEGDAHRLDAERILPRQRTATAVSTTCDLSARARAASRAASRLVARLAEHVAVDDDDRVAADDDRVGFSRGDRRRLLAREPLARARRPPRLAIRLVDVRRPHRVRDADEREQLAPPRRRGGENDARRRLIARARRGRSVVHELDLHHRAELSRLDRAAALAQQRDERLVERLGDSGRAASMKLGRRPCAASP